jgi:hypothetical protein
VRRPLPFPSVPLQRPTGSGSPAPSLGCLGRSPPSESSPAKFSKAVWIKSAGFLAPGCPVQVLLETRAVCTDQALWLHPLRA